MRFLTRLLLLTLVCGLAVVLMPKVSHAEAKVIIKPKIATTYEYDSNFYKASANTRAVHTFLIAPGVTVGYDTGKTTALLDYELSAYFYDDAESPPTGATAADNGNYIGHTLNGTLRSQVSDRLRLGLDESFVLSSDAAETDQFNNTVARDKYYLNRIIPSLYYTFGDKFSAGLRYQNYYLDYETGSREDYLENRGMFDLVYNFNSTNSLDLEYQIWQGDYNQGSSDYLSQQIMMIFRKQLHYFSFEVGGGYHKRDFDAAGLKSIDTFTYRLAILGQNPPAPESPRSHMSLVAQWNFNDLGTGDSYYRAHRISAEAGTIFWEKIPVVISGYYQKADYETGARNDTTYHIDGSFGYLITEWLETDLKTGYETRDSTVNGNDYDNYFIIISVRIVYDMGSR